MPRLQKARDPRHNVNAVNRFHAANEICAAANGLAFHAADENRGRWGSGLLASGGGFFLAARIGRARASTIGSARRAAPFWSRKAMVVILPQSSSGMCRIIKNCQKTNRLVRAWVALSWRRFPAPQTGLEVL
jgi:hypothetical protein